MKAFMLILVILCVSVHATPLSNSIEPLSPVILVPGDGGSQIEGKLNRSAVPHFWCFKKAEEWFTLWLNLRFILPGVTDCFADNLKLHYNHESHTTYNQFGVETRVPGFGNTTSIDYMDPNKNYFTSYFETVIDLLVRELGYKRGLNIRGAPYDFRKAPNEMEDYFKDLRLLIEDTYHSNGKKSVVLIGHSLGNLYILYMLNRSPQDWKDKYVSAHVSLGGPYGGASKTMKMFASGYNVDVHGLSEISVRGMQRTMPSSAFLLPYESFWNKDEILVYGPEQNYTVANYETFFKDINFTLGTQMRSDTENLIKELSPPGVAVYCVYGTNTSTPLSYHYAKVKEGYNWYDSPPYKVDYEDGDGTVNLRSALGCKRWIGKQKAPIVLKDFPAVGHVGMLRKKVVAEYIVGLLKSKI